MGGGGGRVAGEEEEQEEQQLNAEVWAVLHIYIIHHQPLL